MWQGGFTSFQRSKGLGVAAIALMRCFFKHETGTAVVMVAFAMPVLIGSMGLAAEVSYWRLHQRSMQNAADAAVIAAATNNGSSYIAEAQAVAAQLGFKNGTGNITVAVANPGTASGCTANCYTVSIADKVPLFLSSVLGFKGDTTVKAASGSGAQSPATAIAARSTAKFSTSYKYCLLALASSGAQGITSNGASNANLNGCNIMSNTGATCDGGNLNATTGDSHGTNRGCGVTEASNVPAVADPYAGLASAIPPDNCSSYPQEPTKKNSTALPASNIWKGSYNLYGSTIACGDQQLQGNTTITSSAGAVLVIENGRLDTNGYTLTGKGVTIIFSGSNSASYQHIPSGGGGLDMAAPTTGNWSGVAIYQDPKLTTNVDVSAAGNSPTWNITGLVYLPHASVTLSGAAGQSTQGASCFELVADNITINGTGSVFANNTQCATAGLNQVGGGARGTLVN